MKIMLKGDHNRWLTCVNNVRDKDVSESTKDKFIALFEAGHSPYSALDLYKMDLQSEYQEKYYQVVQDRGLCPDLQWCYRYNKEIEWKIINHHKNSGPES